MSVETSLVIFFGLVSCILVLVIFEYFRSLGCKHDWIEKESLILKRQWRGRDTIVGRVYIHECVKCKKIKKQQMTWE